MKWPGFLLLLVLLEKPWKRLRLHTLPFSNAQRTFEIWETRGAQMRFLEVPPDCVYCTTDPPSLSFYCTSEHILLTLPFFNVRFSLHFAALQLLHTVCKKISAFPPTDQTSQHAFSCSLVWKRSQSRDVPAVVFFSAKMLNLKRFMSNGFIQQNLKFTASSLKLQEHNNVTAKLHVSAVLSLC